MSLKKLIPLFLILAGCAAKSQNSNDLVSIQILDRNGFSETVNAKERLNTYSKKNFLAPQPYQKVVRVFGKASLGRTGSKITTYHSNGQPWQYLEIENGRAHGQFIEWHPNGQIKVEALVIAGTPDVSEMAQLTWLFEGASHVYDEEGHLIANIPYEKGLLEGTSHYFYPNGSFYKEIPHYKDEIHGVVKVFDATGAISEKISYGQGEKDGSALGYWTPGQLKYTEEYQKGNLITAEYFDPAGKKIGEIKNGEGIQALFEDAFLASLIEYHRGALDGKVENFDPEGHLISVYHMKDGMKSGEEWEYYPSPDKTVHPKLCLQWSEDAIQGVVKTWYENGVLESQREMHNNKKHGTSFAWYKEGDLMLMEEYEDDRLIKGSYFKKWEKNPVSSIENGKGIATLFDKEGRFVKKIVYEKGLPQSEA